MGVLGMADLPLAQAHGLQKSGGDAMMQSSTQGRGHLKDSVLYSGNYEKRQAWILQLHRATYALSTGLLGASNLLLNAGFQSTPNKRGS